MPRSAASIASWPVGAIVGAELDPILSLLPCSLKFFAMLGLESRFIARLRAALRFSGLMPCLFEMRYSGYATM